MFRELTTSEKTLAQRIKARGKTTIDIPTSMRGVKVDYQVDGNFTVALLKVGTRVYAGVAKRNPIDRESHVVGKEIALARAIENT